MPPDPLEVTRRIRRYSCLSKSPRTCLSVVKAGPLEYEFLRLITSQIWSVLKGK